MRITGVNKTFDIDVNLVGSKSESNRVLMIGYYGGFKPRVKNLSESDDTKLLTKLINGIKGFNAINAIKGVNAAAVMVFNCSHHSNQNTKASFCRANRRCSME